MPAAANDGGSPGKSGRAVGWSGCIARASARRTRRSASDRSVGGAGVRAAADNGHGNRGGGGGSAPAARGHPSVRADRSSGGRPPLPGSLAADLALFAESELVADDALRAAAPFAPARGRECAHVRSLFSRLGQVLVARTRGARPPDLFLAQTAADAARLRSLGAAQRCRLREPEIRCAGTRRRHGRGRGDAARDRRPTGTGRPRARIRGRTSTSSPHIARWRKAERHSSPSSHPGTANAVRRSPRSPARPVFRRHCARGARGSETVTDIYLADTVGEMGLWYRLADMAFLGGRWRRAAARTRSSRRSSGCRSCMAAISAISAMSTRR